MRKGRYPLCAALAALLSAVLLAGCAGLRWEAPPRSGEAPEPELAREALFRAAPVRLQVLSSILFEYRGRRMPGLGFLDLDAATRSLGLACLSPAGVTLFEVTGRNGEMRCHFALEAFTNRGAFAEIVARDFERMFFDLQPPRGTAEAREPGAAVFSEPAGRGRVEWVAGGDGRLLEKRYYEGKRLKCRIGYYEPVARGGRRIPGRVRLQNLKHGYGLTVTVREIRQCD